MMSHDLGVKLTPAFSLCHIASQISEPPFQASEMMLHAHGKVVTIVVLLSELVAVIIGLQSIVSTVYTVLLWLFTDCFSGRST